MGSRLVIVESPAKARTIAGFLGRDFVVESSIGHIRDLPVSSSDVEGPYKKWEVLGVDVENDFKPLYLVNQDKKSHVSGLKKLLKDADELYLATDEDREGEAIAWHLLEVLNPPQRIPVKRMVFHEITPAAIQHAIDNPREIDRRLVDAQEARRILDRIYGYKVSEVLWRKVPPARSAGRVQSVATRIVVEREWERMRFVPAGYWDLDATFAALTGTDAGRTFTARLATVDDLKVATGKDFDSNGRLTRTGTVALDETAARTLVAELDGRPFTVGDVDSRPYRRSPAAPFITSTLQQEAGRKLRLSSQQTMRAAQSLYEQGYITYMRTDSTTLSDTALAAARSVVTERYGAEYLPPGPRQYTKKVKNAQEAHEAIRPAGERFRSPEEVGGSLGGRSVEARVYELIWQRTIASQMTDALGNTVTVRVDGTTATGRRASFSASGTIITHAGFQRVYVEDTDDAEDADGDERRLPQVAQGDGLRADELEAKGHETQPPARFTEASLVKRLEELGVGRPSTYASIMSTIQDRGYVWKKGSALVPSLTAFALVRLLEDHFPNLVDYAFTARMEDDLDGIASGSGEAIPWLSKFYFGDHSPEGAGLRQMLAERLDTIDAREISTIPLGKDSEGVEVVARVGRYGPYIQRGEDRTSIPEDLPPDELTVPRALELLAAPSGDRELGADPVTGQTVYVRNGRFGPYVQLGEDPTEKNAPKPKRASLFKDMDPTTIGLDDAVQLLQLPRTVGVAEDGVEVVVANGRFGPFVRKGEEIRSLETEAQLLTLTMPEALELLAQPKRRRGQSAPKGPLRELGPDPVSGKPLVIKDGRFGPYVTDGETNASLRKGDVVEELSMERALELLQDRRDRGPATKGRRKPAGGAAKKTPARKTPAKKVAATGDAAAGATTRKTATKKTATKKTATKKAATKKAPTKKAATNKTAATIAGDASAAEPAAGTPDDN
ncbi:MAG: type I DNA topoisomerase [Acidimicrobiales bacterium]|nr:type I DNA topoisomerase [Acidimicrobiales bacterium]